MMPQWFEAGRKRRKHTARANERQAASKYKESWRSQEVQRNHRYLSTHIEGESGEIN